MIPGSQKRPNGVFQIFDTLEDSTVDCLGIQFAKPAFDQIQPTGTGREEGERQTRMALWPGPDILVFMRPVVIHDEMEGDLSWELFVERAQEAKIPPA